MNRFDEHLNIPCFIILVFLLPQTVCIRGQRQGGVVVEAGVGPDHDPDDLGHGGGVDLPAAKLEQGGPALLHTGGEVVAHLEDEVGQGPVQEAHTPLDCHDGGLGVLSGVEGGQQE